MEKATEERTVIRESREVRREVQREVAEDRAVAFNGPVAVVTGANHGIGYAMAEGLLTRGYHVILACRNAQKGKEAARKLEESTKVAPELMIVDLASFRSIAQFANSLRERHKTVDVLINNAGVALAEKKLTIDGVEETIQVNFLGPVYLTWLIMDLLKHARDARVINVTADIGKSTDFQVDDLSFEKRRYDWKKAFGQSKICLAMFSAWLQRYADIANLNMKVFSLNPGKVKTSIFRREHGFNVDPWGMTWREGALGVFRAIEDDTLLGGEHLHEGKVGHISRIVTDPRKQLELMKRAFAMCNLDWEF